jgi:hypothetical protein
MSLLSLANSSVYSLCYLDKNSSLGCVVFDAVGSVVSQSDNLLGSNRSKVDYFKQIELANNILIYVHKLDYDATSPESIDELVLVDKESLAVLKRVNVDYYLNDLAANAHLLFCLNLSREVYAFGTADLSAQRQQLLDLSELPIVTIQMECNANCLFFLYSEHLYSFKMRIMSIRTGRVLHDFAVCGDQFKFLTNDIFVFYCDFKKKLHLFNWEDENNVAGSMSEEVYDVVGSMSGKTDSNNNNNNGNRIGNDALAFTSNSNLRLLKGKNKNLAFIDLNNFTLYFTC